jgi:predicted dinucleotide-binding enzyme
MRIGIIGAGQVGGTLAWRLAKAGDEIAIANSREPETLRELVKPYGERVRAVTAGQAAAFGEVVIAAVPFGRHRELPGAGLDGKPVIDVCNYDPRRDGHYPELDQDLTTSSELVQEHLGEGCLVKALNTLRWEQLRDAGRQSSAMLRYGIPVSGDDARAKRMVLDLVEQLGFDPVDVGDLATGGRRQQPGTPVFGVELTGAQLRARLDREPPGRPIPDPGPRAEGR